MKALRKITVPNPALSRMDTPADGFTHKDGKDGSKEFVAKHPVEKVSDANGNDDKHFTASNISRAKYNRADESFVNKLLGRSDKVKSDKPKDDPKIRNRPKIEKKNEKLAELNSNGILSRYLEADTDISSKRLKGKSLAYLKLTGRGKVPTVDRQNRVEILPPAKLAKSKKRMTTLDLKANEGFIQAIKDKLSSKKNDDAGTLQNRIKRATAGSNANTRKDWMGKTKTNESTIVNPETRLVKKPHYESNHEAHDVFHNDQHLGSVNSYTSKIPGYHPNGKDGKPDPKFDPYHKWMSNPKQEDGQMFKRGRSGHSSKDSAVRSLKDSHGIYEEVIQELSDKTIKNYLGKAAFNKSMAEKSAHRAAVDYDRLGKAKDLKKVDSSVDKVRRRNTGITKALNKIRKEDLEQLDELSRKTLGSYIKKAHVSGLQASHHQETAAQSLSKYTNKNPNASREQVKNTPSFKKLSKYGRAGENREAGINRAASRLTREELNELSKRLKTNYVSKAVDDVAASATKITTASRDWKNSFKRRIANRKAGIRAAMKD